MPAGKHDDGVVVLLSDDDEQAPAPVDAETQERIRQEAEEFRRRRAEKKQVHARIASDPITSPQPRPHP